MRTETLKAQYHTNQGYMFGLPVVVTEDMEPGACLAVTEQKATDALPSPEENRYG